MGAMTRTLMAALIGMSSIYGVSSAFAQTTCESVGNAVAQQRGARLLAAAETTDGGQAACEIVLLVTPSDGSRPKREVVVVRQ